MKILVSSSHSVVQLLSVQSSVDIGLRAEWSECPMSIVFMKVI